MSTEQNQLAVAPAKPRASHALAAFIGMEPSAMLDTIKSQCFKGVRPDQISDAQLAAFVSIANEMKVNPLLPGMLYAYPSQGAIVPMMGPDGVYKRLTEHPEVDSWETVVYPEDVLQPPTHAVTKIYRKGRERPLSYTALLSEWKVNSNPNWNTRARHMLGLRSLKQCARQIIHGIPFDEDERSIMGAIDVTGTGDTPAPPRPPPPPRKPKGAAAVKEVVVEETFGGTGAAVATMPAVAEAPKAEPAPEPAKPVEAPAPAAESPDAPDEIPGLPEVRTELVAGETITITARVITSKVGKAGDGKPYVGAEVESASFKGAIYDRTGAPDGTIRAEYLGEAPVRLTLKGEKQKSGKVLAFVDKVEAV